MNEVCEALSPHDALSYQNAARQSKATSEGKRSGNDDRGKRSSVGRVTSGAAEFGERLKVLQSYAPARYSYNVAVAQLV